MEHFTKIVPFLWEILGRNKKGAVNVTTKENEIIVSIWSGRRWKRFKNINPDLLITDIRQSYQLN